MVLIRYKHPPSRSPLPQQRPSRVFQRHKKDLRQRSRNYYRKYLFKQRKLFYSQTPRLGLYLLDSGRLLSDFLSRTNFWDPRNCTPVGIFPKITISPKRRKQLRVLYRLNSFRTPRRRFTFGFSDYIVLGKYYKKIIRRHWGKKRKQLRRAKAPAPISPILRPPPRRIPAPKSIVSQTKDPLAQLVSNLNQGCSQGVRRVVLHQSLLTTKILMLLYARGFITNFYRSGKRRLSVSLRFYPDGQSLLANFKLWSYFSRPRYFSHCDLVKLARGSLRGCQGIIHTSVHGLISVEEAVYLGSGGQLLFSFALILKTYT